MQWEVEYSIFKNIECKGLLMELKPQDLLVLLKVAASPHRRWTYAALAVDLAMSTSQVHASVKRAT